jgi:hypothetical protein
VAYKRKQVVSLTDRPVNGNLQASNALIDLVGRQGEPSAATAHQTHQCPLRRTLKLQLDQLHHATA